MSNAGQALSAVAGGVIGFFVGGPTGAVYGFQLGLMAGSVLFPTQLPGVQGPKLGDGQQTTSIVGTPIPWLVGGTQRVGGIVIWASPIREVAQKQQQGGKGSPEQSQTTYKYYRSFAILMCEPPDSLGGVPIGGVRRIWANGKLIFDRTEPLTVNLGDQSSINLLSGREALNSSWTRKMTIYTGTEDQMPDPVIESFEGVGNVHGYRGYAYVVFDDVELKPEDGNRIPASWSFEVYESGSSEDINLGSYANERLYPWDLDEIDPRPIGNVYSYSATGTNSGDFIYDSSLQAVNANNNANPGAEYGWPMLHDYLRGWYPTLDNGFELMPWARQVDPGGDDDITFCERLYVLLSYPRWPTDNMRIGGSHEFCDLYPATAEPFWSYVPFPGGFPIYGRVTVSVSAVPNIFGIPPGAQSGICGGGIYRWEIDDGTIWVFRSPSPPPAACYAPLPDAPGFCVNAEGYVVPDEGWERDDSTVYRALSKYQDDGLDVTSYPMDPVRPLGHLQYDDQEFWESAYGVAVAKGQLPSGWTYGVQYPETQAYGWRIPFETRVVETDPVSLATLVSRVCNRAGHRVDLLYDVEDLVSIFLLGYQVSRPTAARAAIDVLRPVGFFDAVESGIQLRFVTRGKAPVMTLELEDLGAHFAESGHVPDTLSQKKLEFELPRQVRVHYMNPLRDLQPGEEPSPSREDTKAQSIVDVEVPVAIETDDAARIAEVTARELWVSRYAYTSQVDVSKRMLEPTDCVILPVDDRLERVRIVTTVDMLPNLRVLNMLKDDDGTYVSTAIGADRFIVPSVLQYYGPVQGVLLDLPPLDVETDDDAGFYFAARPLINGGSFRGATLSRSTDGTNFTTVSATADATPMGVVLYDVPAGPTTVFDWGSEIVVQMKYGELESRDRDDVLNGANAAAIGADGRWEIVQFLEAEEIARDIWRLRGLLRGRRGTEWIMLSDPAGPDDLFVMLSAGTLARVPMDPAAVNLEMTYRSTATGRPLETADDALFTGRGSSLRPFSPVHVEGEQDVDGDWAFEWFRRDRLATDVVIPMSEELEDYEVDVMKEGTAIRTISVLTKSATYTAVQQVVDFGAVQSTVTIRVYQISAAVGRSYPQEITITSEVPTS